MCLILNVSGFSIFHDCEYTRVLNFQGLAGFQGSKIWQGSKYALGVVCKLRKLVPKNSR